MTNGCFDILHPGHIHYLRQAKQFGDILIVALNSDSSVSQLKGPTRPICDAATRSLMLSALSFVDYVIIFDELTPDSLYKKFTPDVLVKGSDYIGSTVVGSNYVLSNGGSVEFVDVKQNYSTSNLVSTILKKYST